MRRTYRRRRLAAAAVAASAVAAVVGALVVVPELTEPPAISAGKAITALVDDEPSSTTSSTTAPTTTTTAPTTAPPTTAPPTTAAPTAGVPATGEPTAAAPTTGEPTAPAPPAGMTIGALVGGPGPIPVVHRVPTFDPVVFITIDDGVVQDPDVIEILRSRGVPVTQFLTLQYVKSNPAFFQQLQQIGGVVGNHSRSHENIPKLDAGSQQDQLCGTATELAGIFGAAPELYRPPYGEYDAASLQVAASCGHKVAMHWSATFEAGRLSLQEGTTLRPGEVILMHFKDTLASDLQILLDMIAAAGLRPASLIDYVHAAPPAPAV
jgi:peptidoglycan/xylan/chitin deacetylase (PgdA/CDA1 family)